MTMEAGKLDKRITIEDLAEPHDSQSGTKAKWAKVKEVWASIETPSGREIQHAEQTTAIATHKITIRWQAALANLAAGTHRVKHGNQIYGIDFVGNPRQANETLELMCVEAK